MAQKSQFSSDLSDLLVPLTGLLLGIGNVWFVDAGDSNASDSSGAGRTVGTPFSTLAFAVGQTTPSNGDIIILSPGHTETISAADGIRFGTASVGVQVIGVGQGTNRPTFDFTTVAAADMEIDAANITLRNLLFTMNGVDAIVAGIDVNASDFSMIGCEVQMSTSANQAVIAVDLDANADNAKIVDCQFLAPNVGAAEAIEISGALTKILIRDLWIDGDFSDACVHSTSVFTQALIRDSFFKNDQTTDHALEFTAAATGFLVNNRYHTDINPASAEVVDPGSLFSFECYAVDLVDLSGILEPAAT